MTERSVTPSVGLGLHYAALNRHALGRRIMFRFKLIPEQPQFFELLQRSADNIVAAAEALAQLFEDYTDVERRVRHLKDLEHVGDDITHEIFHELNQSFVTPFDRDDIAELTTALDDLLDWIEEAARRLHVYHVRQPRPLALRFAHILRDQARIIAQLMPQLRRLNEVSSIRASIVELHRLENEGDDLMEEGLGRLYQGIDNIQELILAVQWKDIYEVLEFATDRGERVGVVVEAILVKHG